MGVAFEKKEKNISYFFTKLQLISSSGLLLVVQSNIYLILDFCILLAFMELKSLNNVAFQIYLFIEIEERLLRHIKYIETGGPKL